MTLRFRNMDQQGLRHGKKILQAVDLPEVNFVKIKAKWRDLPFNPKGEMGDNHELTPCIALVMHPFAYLGQQASTP
jgi:hypothetical protein